MRILFSQCNWDNLTVLPLSNNMYIALLIISPITNLLYMYCDRQGHRLTFYKFRCNCSDTHE